MGIKNLMQLIQEHCPTAVKEQPLSAFQGRKLAVDASGALYAFLVAVRSEGQMLMTEEGSPTSHLLGLLWRTIRMTDAGIKPLYVFDGAPPKLKSGELAKRWARKNEAQENHDEAKETGTAEDVEKFSRRTVRVTREQNLEAQRLLQLMGIPFIVAPTEAEAQCAALARAGKVYAAASEDMDTLAFNTPVLVRKLTFAEARKEPIQEIQLDKVLEGLDLTLDGLISLGCLAGCDYLDNIKGLGAKTALALVREHKTLDKIVEHIKGNSRYTLPEDWPYEDARQLFLEPDVRPADDPLCEFKWESPDVEGLVKFLVEEKGFSEDRVRNAAARLQKSVKAVPQARLDGFFKVLPKTEEEKANLKRKNEEKVEAQKKQKKAEAKAKKEAKAKPKMNS